MKTRRHLGWIVACVFAASGCATGESTEEPLGVGGEAGSQVGGGAGHSGSGGLAGTGGKGGSSGASGQGGSGGTAKGGSAGKAGSSGAGAGGTAGEAGASGKGGDAGSGGTTGSGGSGGAGNGGSGGEGGSGGSGGVGGQGGSGGSGGVGGQGGSGGSGGTGGVGGQGGSGGTGGVGGQGGSGGSGGTGGLGGQGGSGGSGGTGGLGGQGGSGGTGGVGGQGGSGGSGGVGGQGGSGGSGGVGGQGGSGGTGGSGGATVDTCPGLVLPLTGSGTAPRVGSASGNTSTLANNTDGTCGGMGPDAVYAVTPDVSGTMSIDLGGSSVTTFDSLLYVRTTCATYSSEVSCNEVGTNGGELITLQVTGGTTYYIFVDGYAGASGPYTVNVKVVPPGCGNGVKESGEECDDGNTSDGDGCDHLCKLEGTGAVDTCPGASLTLTQNGLKFSGGASGDTTTLKADYSGTCGMTSSSEDAVYHFNSGPGGETTVKLTTASYDSVLYVRQGSCTGTQVDCDDASGDGGDTVTFTATANTDYWVFVDGYWGESGTYQLSVQISGVGCGDGVLQSGEECDDGNATANDGCSATCTWEGSCGSLAESEPNPWDSPHIIPAACGSFQIQGSIPDNDADYYQITLAAGAVLTASTFVGTPGTCVSGADTVLTLYDAPLSSKPNESGGCGYSTYLECNDQDSNNTPCSTLSHTTTAAGQYILKVHNYYSYGDITSYGLFVMVQ